MLSEPRQGRYFFRSLDEELGIQELFYSRSASGPAPSYHSST